MLLSMQALAADIPAGVSLSDSQKLVINNGTEPSSLDPQKSEGVPESDITLNLLEGLVTTDNNGKLVPGVAQSWQNQQGKVWTFTLRSDARWNNGEPVTAADFVYSWQRLVSAETASPYASFAQAAHLLNADKILARELPASALGVRALDAHHVEVTLAEPVPYFLAMVAHTAFKPLNRRTIETWGEKWTQPAHYVGNGAYTLSDWVINEKIVLKRNPHYWNNRKTAIEQVTFLPISSETSDVNRYRSGEIDISNSALPPDRFQQLKQQLGAQVHVSPYLCTFYYELNNRRPPFNDARVRTAVKMTLDRSIIAEKIMGQGQIPAYSLTPPYTDGAALTPPAWFTLSQPQRNQQAKALLAEAGYNATHPLRFSLLYNTSDVNKQQAIAAASMWNKNLGAQVTLQNQEWKTLLDSRHQGNYDVARATWCSDYNEPSTFLNMMIGNASTNTTFYRSAAFDELMKRSLTVADDVQRAQIYQQAEQRLDEDSALVPVYYRVSARLIKPWVGGYSGKDPQDHMDVKYFYITQH
ncbi:Oligopeptide ABC transport system, periplasmic protein precursor oppA [Erwinia amylovora ACW56400]|nr:Oligopeptide ABC transport system, periplasmic protein precursor oppA [Erwinia amylovora ACW56400]QJQ69249.1 Oligopeptide ABC transport system, periplasmic protein precursor oppA [Erwinia amylovora]CCO82594.1 Oligopeptide ABC transport system, periplasmic protein precursor oppA [Erwinia amylovora Ea266]CCO86375.1 Oligopeptide ABC transport system, periplasmic protein precursor oppA [Erwinia amylovora CFBP 2585]CCO90161.1 Oligopeptide ABC transport system, periplasmic protein precursor oppA [